MRKNLLLVVVIMIWIVFICSACNPDRHSLSNEGTTNDIVAQEDGVFTVVIDPGHGGKDVGATGASGEHEKNFTLNLSRKVEELLSQEPDIEVILTRSDDRFLSQESRYRPKFANELNADLFVSIHGNTFDDHRVSGTETFYYHKHSRTLAQILQAHVVDATGFRNRGVKKEQFFVVKDTEMPAVLLEIGYLTNPEDERLMLTDPFQNRVAKAIVAGIKKYWTL